MKLLLFYAPSFWFKTFSKTLEDVDDVDVEESVEDAAVVFYHVEEGDVERRGSVLTKMVKNIKWIAGKFDTRNVVLHSFNHLSMSKAPPYFSRALALEAKERLERTGYTITETPFGYFNEWKIHVGGESLAKVFKEF